MWHALAFVAESRNLETGDLTRFALDNAEKYGVVQVRGEPEVNTWHVDQLVADFKAAREDALNKLSAQAQELGMGY